MGCNQSSKKNQIISVKEPIANQAFDYQLLKLVLVGDCGVGKSSILLRYTEDVFEDTVSSIGFDFKAKIIDVDGMKVKLQIWDTAGQERFRTLTSSYYRGAHIIFCVIDVLMDNWEDSIRSWILTSNSYAPNNCEKVIIVNKIDLESTIDETDLERLANELGLSYYFVSAKENTNLDDTVLKTVQATLDPLL